MRSLSLCQPTQAAIRCFHGWGWWWCIGFASWETERLIRSMGTPPGRRVISDIWDFGEAQAEFACILNLLFAAWVAFSYHFHSSAPAKPTGMQNFSAQVQYLIPYSHIISFKGQGWHLHMVPDWIIWGDQLEFSAAFLTTLHCSVKNVPWLWSLLCRKGKTCWPLYEHYRWLPLLRIEPSVPKSWYPGNYIYRCI